MSSFIVSLLLISCSYVHIFQLSNAAELMSPCDNPLGKKGLCMPLSNCPSLAGISTQQPTSDANLFFLQKSLCGVDSKTLQAMVCCAETFSPTSELPPTSTTAKPEIETSTKSPEELQDEIKYHPNLNLLPNIRLCGYNTASQRIIGGSAAGLGTYPWMALIGYKDANGPMQYGCGATLISARYVLTAAHCLLDLPGASEFTPSVVVLGEYDKSKAIDCDDTGVCAPPPQNIPIEKIITHEDYNKNKQNENDIALIRLKKEAILGPFVAPICLPVNETVFKSMILLNNQLYIAGWGRTTSDSEDNANILQDALVPLVPEKQCLEIYRQKLKFETLGPGRFCAGGEKGKDSCHGDSGGPIMQTLNVPFIKNITRAFQFGIVSMGADAECGKENIPSLYTRVTSYMKWILDNLKA